MVIVTKPLGRLTSNFAGSCYRLGDTLPIHHNFPVTELSTANHASQREIIFKNIFFFFFFFFFLSPDLILTFDCQFNALSRFGIRAIENCVTL